MSLGTVQFAPLLLGLAARHYPSLVGGGCSVLADGGVVRQAISCRAALVDDG